MHTRHTIKLIEMKKKKIVDKNIIRKPSIKSVLSFFHMRYILLMFMAVRAENEMVVVVSTQENYHQLEKYENSFE